MCGVQWFSPVTLYLYFTTLKWFYIKVNARGYSTSSFLQDGTDIKEKKRAYMLLPLNSLCFCWKDHVSYKHIGPT